MIRYFPIPHGEVAEYDFSQFSAAKDPLHKAFCDWFTFHGIDWTYTPSEGRVARMREERVIVYSKFRTVVRNGTEYLDSEIIDGERETIIDTLYQQGETPPLPFPTPLHPEFDPKRMMQELQEELNALREGKISFHASLRYAGKW